MKLDLLPCVAHDGKSPTRRKIIANIFGKEVGEKSAHRVCLLSRVNKYTAELSFGSSCNTLLRSAQISTEICIKLITRRRIKGRDRRRSFSISLNFHQAILESSPQMRFMFDIKKLLFINALTFIPGETQDDLLRIAIDLPEFPQISEACRPRY